MYKWTLILALVMTLAACSSPIKLNEVNVEDKSGQASVAMKTLTPATSTAAGDKKANVATLDTTAGTKNATGAGAGTDALAAANARIIYFEFDSFVIRPEYQAMIETHARNLKVNKNQRISIEGHTDERGGREYNLALGQKRADSVRKALSLLGVPDAQMESVSFGKEKPAITGDTEVAMEKNRRAEMVIR
jgi:peptidoglycan-associated lipoprotein